MSRELRLEPVGANIPDIRIENALDIAWHFLNTGHSDQAYVACDAILRHGHYHNSDALYLCGAILHSRGDFETAYHCYGESLRYQPGYSGGHVERMMDLVRSGERGPEIPEQDWPWVCEGSDSALYRNPFWSGCTPLDGKTIFLHDEAMGLGDVIQYCRYTRLIRDRGAGQILVQCDGRLSGFLETCTGVDRVVPHGEPTPDFDIHSRLWGLTGIFGMDSDCPYLSAEPGRVERWRRQIDEFPGFRVGIAWQGNPNHVQDRDRSLSLSRFEPMARIPGVTLVSLQRGYGFEQLRDCPFPVVDFGEEVDPGLATFDDTPALIANLNLVISADTCVAHAAGALGIPVWIALPCSPDWRWFRDRTDSPWYPTARLFRQETPGDWDGVFDRIAHELSGLTR